MKKHPLHNIDRSKLFLAGIFFVFIIIVFRLFQIQVLNFSRYKSLAREQHGDLHIMPAKRGAVFTNDGYPVAFSAPNYYLYLPPINNSLKVNPQDIVKRLKTSSLLPEDKVAPLYEEINNSPDKSVRIAYPFNWNEKESIIKLIEDVVEVLPLRDIPYIKEIS